MKAQEIPVGGRFSLPGDDTVYTVLNQWPGRMPGAQFTAIQFWNAHMSAFSEMILSGHTEVIAHPETTASLTAGG